MSIAAGNTNLFTKIGIFKDSHMGHSLLISVLNGKANAKDHSMYYSIYNMFRKSKSENGDWLRKAWKGSFGGDEMF